MFDEAAHQRRDEVLGRLMAAIREGAPIPVPPADAARPSRSSAFAGINPLSGFAGEAGAWRYLFEGEDDLLHLVVERRDGVPFPVEEASAVVEFVLPEVPRGLIWVKQGTVSHHFYCGHECLLARPTGSS